MKQKDLALIIVVIFISALASVFISKSIFGAASHDQKAESVQAISPDFEKPDDRFFNKDAIDPTQTINIEQSTNTEPFRANGQ